jgi:hypothetical protein
MPAARALVPRGAQCNKISHGDGEKQAAAKLPLPVEIDASPLIARGSAEVEKAVTRLDRLFLSRGLSVQNGLRAEDPTDGRKDSRQLMGPFSFYYFHDSTVELRKEVPFSVILVPPRPFIIITNPSSRNLDRSARILISEI